MSLRERCRGPVEEIWFQRHVQRGHITVNTFQSFNGCPGVWRESREGLWRLGLGEWGDYIHILARHNHCQSSLFAIPNTNTKIKYRHKYQIQPKSYIYTQAYDNQCVVHPLCNFTQGCAFALTVVKLLKVVSLYVLHCVTLYCCVLLCITSHYFVSLCITSAECGAHLYPHLGSKTKADGQVPALMCGLTMAGSYLSHQHHHHEQHHHYHHKHQHHQQA